MKFSLKKKINGSNFSEGEVNSSSKETTNKAKKSKSSKILFGSILLIIVGVIISIGIYLAYFAFFKTDENVQITNVLPNSATVIWVSDFQEPGVALAFEGEAPAYHVGRNGDAIVGFDDRDYATAELDAAISNSEAGANKGEDIIASDLQTDVKVTKFGRYTTHHVTFKNLDPETTYEVLIGDGNMFKSTKNSEKITFTSKPQLEDFDVPYPAYGNVVDEENNPVTDGILTLQIIGADGSAYSEIAAVPLGSNGSWYVDLSSLYTTTGESLFKYLSQDDFSQLYEELKVITKNGVYVKVISTEEDSPAGNFQLSADSLVSEFSNDSKPLMGSLISRAYAWSTTCGGTKCYVTSGNDESTFKAVYNGPDQNPEAEWKKQACASGLPNTCEPSGGGGGGSESPPPAQEPPPSNNCSGGAWCGSACGCITWAQFNAAGASSGCNEYREKTKCDQGGGGTGTGGNGGNTSPPPAPPAPTAVCCKDNNGVKFWTGSQDIGSCRVDGMTYVGKTTQSSCSGGGTTPPPANPSSTTGACCYNSAKWEYAGDGVSGCPGGGSGSGVMSRAQCSAKNNTAPPANNGTTTKVCCVNGTQRDWIADEACDAKKQQGWTTRIDINVGACTNQTQSPAPNAPYCCKLPSGQYDWLENQSQNYCSGTLGGSPESNYNNRDTCEDKNYKKKVSVCCRQAYGTPPNVTYSYARATVPNPETYCQVTGRTRDESREGPGQCLNTKENPVNAKIAEDPIEEPIAAEEVKNVGTCEDNKNSDSIFCNDQCKNAQGNVACTESQFCEPKLSQQQFGSIYPFWKCTAKPYEDLPQLHARTLETYTQCETACQDTPNGYWKGSCQKIKGDVNSVHAESPQYESEVSKYCNDPNYLCEFKESPSGNSKFVVITKLKGKCTYEKASKSSLNINEQKFELSSNFYDSIVFTSNAQSEIPENAVVFSPEKGAYLFGETGKYYFIYKEKVYEVLLTNENSKYIIYIDENKDRIYDPTVDTLIAQDPILLGFNKISAASKYDISIGYNFISFDFITNESGSLASDYIELLNDKYSGLEPFYSISTYDSGKWKTIGSREDGTYGADDFQIVPGRGYLLRSKNDIDLELTGYKILDPVPIAFTKGWNFVALHGSSTNYTAESWLYSIDEDSSVDANNVTRWDNSRSKYDGLQIDLGENETEQVYGFDFPIMEKSAYFVRVINGEGRWTPE